MAAELFLAVAGVLDGCIKLANKAITTCKAFRNADKDIKDQVLKLETVWTKLESQLGLIHKMNGHLSSELAQNHFNLLDKLEGVLTASVKQLERAALALGTTGTGNPKGVSKLIPSLGRWKYALMRKSLDVLIKDLEEWQERFDPSWYLIQLISSEVLNPVLLEFRGSRAAVNSPSSSSNQTRESAPSPLDNMLALRQAIDDGKGALCSRYHQSPIAYDETRLDPTTQAPIPYSTAMTVLQVKPHKTLLIVEPIDLSAGVTPQLIPNAEHLARKLQHIDPGTFNLLRCEGIIKKQDQGHLSIIYESSFPKGPPPLTLRHLLLNHAQSSSISLSTIITVAKQLVRSVSFIHACDLVHKNIRPDNTLIFPNNNNNFNLFLIGFSQFRSVTLLTNFLGDTPLHRNLYRHPDLQGLCITEKYTMQHDIYSLGVCDIKPGFPLEAALRNDLSDADFANAQVPGTTSWIKEDLVEMAKNELPQQMGDLYTDVWVKGDDGSDGIAVGVRFVERILGRVGEIVV
ncbi:hypothetical protein QBC38DRAFT_537698 [Podospora fimiseda]|uniref:Protein kinase domain-containing protein n=1 Tax=Podospora fimiseda TaxID=252190 RepID=A0AAN7H195_9PEZI|nr:hypothetical protein QBC38DRAFT_537698 [Podospora fimiseda]